MKRPNETYFEHIDANTLSDGTTLLTLRPIESKDGQHALEFRQKLSDKSIKDRFLGYIPSTTNNLIKRLTQFDTSIECAIVAETKNTEKKEVIAIARIVKDANDSADFAIIIADEWQGKGLGIKMTHYMVAIAKQMGFKRMHALVYSTNLQMLEILKEIGFHLKVEDNATTFAELVL